VNGEPFGPHLPREAWEAWLADRLDGTARRRIEDHLAECAECTAWVARTDPSHLFHRLGTPVPEPAWNGFWEGIQGDLAGPPRRRLSVAAAAGMAAAVALMALVAVVAQEDADPCAQATLAAMNLSRPITEEECRLLHGGIVLEDTPVVVLRASVDLRGL
jgi:predicted anti-sigma-YlaC factor YlaD